MQLSLDGCRWVYNKTLETRKKAWEEMQVGISLYDTIKLLPKWKEENKFLSNAYSQCLQETQSRVDFAFKSFFRRVKKGENPGYPRFRSYDRYDSFTYPQSGFSLINSKLKLSKIGSIKIKLDRPLKEKIKTLTVRKSATDKWCACFSCEVEIQPLPKVESVVGIDVGLESFATFSNGDKIDNPRFFKTDQKKLAKAQRKFSKEEKGNGKRKKLKKVISRIHEKITNRRKDFEHKESLKIVKGNQVIVFEKLDIKNMQENGIKYLHKSIADVAWNQFIQFTSYKAEWAGRTVICVDPRNTSKRCSRCGIIVEKTLGDRIHSCSCGLVMDRDQNAAINILALGMQSLMQV